MANRISVKKFKHIVPVVGTFLFLTFSVFALRNGTEIKLPFHGGDAAHSGDVASVPVPISTPVKEPAHQGIGGSTSVFTQSHPVYVPGKDNGQDSIGRVDKEHREIFSVSTADGKFFRIKWGHLEGINPNILPHPRLNDTWVIVAQQHAPSVALSVWFAELTCNANFTDGALSCIAPPQILPMAATAGPDENCAGDLNFFSRNVGPHDARVFFGPESPYAIWGSNSQFTCFGQWVEDFRLMMDWGLEPYKHDQFRTATEIQRPEKYGRIEKNYFLFWDPDGNMYAHYDIRPKRVFAKLAYNGTTGPDLAPLSSAQDTACMAAHMPAVAAKLESIHQATNSLSITMCAREDPTCTPTDENTFILTIVQHKSYYGMHSVYEPYAVLFNRRAPFALHAISTRPLWISGRGRPGGWEKEGWDEGTTGTQTQMFYVTSVSWRDRGLKYHGYIDDVVYLGFGIEDHMTGGIDVRVGDLLLDLGICEAE